MNKKLITILTVAGALIGIGIGNMLYKKIFKKQIEEEKQMEEETNEIIKNMTDDFIKDVSNKNNKKEKENGK